MEVGRDIQAAVFDVFGTVVDWRGSIVATARRAAGGDDRAVDWGTLADRWRQEGYLQPIQAMVGGAQPWEPINIVLDRHLRRLAGELGVAGPVVDALSSVWDHLDPWPDVRPGLARLRSRCVLAPLSNGTFASLTRMGRHADLGWDCIIATELFSTYKPDPRTYEGAAHLLGLRPDQVLMVAAHPGDLAAAGRSGLRTAYVPRPLEWGPDGPTPQPYEADVVAPDFGALAAALGA